MGGGVESTMTARPGAHGMFDGPAFRRGRVISIPGTCVAPDRPTAEAAADQLAGLLADGSMGTMSVTNAVTTRTAKVRLSAEPVMSWLSPTAFSWTLQFTAPDWRKYDPPVSHVTALAGGGTGLTFPIGAFFDFGTPGSTGAIILTNTGNAPTEPVFKVTAPLAAGFRLTYVETGQIIDYPAAVVADTIIDCAAGTVVMGGADRTGLLDVDQFFSVPAGATATFQFSTLGAETYASPTRATATLYPANS
jgi:hypothetical protein